MCSMPLKLKLARDAFSSSDQQRHLQFVMNAKKSHRFVRLSVFRLFGHGPVWNWSSIRHERFFIDTGAYHYAAHDGLDRHAFHVHWQVRVTGNFKNLQETADLAASRENFAVWPTKWNSIPAPFQSPTAWNAEWCVILIPSAVSYMTYTYLSKFL